MKGKPLLTLITPFYNNSGTFFATLDSVLMQTYPAIEYIVVDDGSSDFDEEAIDRYVRERNRGNIVEFSVVRLGKNEGTVKALNSALKRAKSEYIFTLAADDCFADEEVLSDWMEEFLRTGAMVLAAKRDVYDTDLKNYRYTAPSKEHVKIIRDSSPAELFEALSGYNFIFSCCTAYRKQCYETIGWLDERYRLVDDYPMNMKLLRKGIPILFFDRVVIKYRLGGISNADRIDRNYIRQANKMFFRESFAHSKHKGKALRAYLQWRNRIRLKKDKKVFGKKFLPEQSKSGKIKYRFVMFLTHPCYMLCRIVRKKR